MADMTLLNHERPPIFCPGCSHDHILKVLDKAFLNMGLDAKSICMVSDIGCSGFFDVFFNTHAFHGVHGRALTYAAGLKLSRPDLNVVVTMGDGGLGIGGAHVLSACRRNLDLTLLVLNNFNFGMTGGQYSATTPNEATVGSGFLNRLDKPLDLNAVARAAGAPFVCTCSSYGKDLADILERAIKFKGFSIVETEGICPGRYTKRNKITPADIEKGLAGRDISCGEVPENQRPEYYEAYKKETDALPAVPRPAGLEKTNTAPESGRKDVVILGSAGQRVITAGELLGLSGISAGLNVTQKNEYNVTVLRGPSVAEMILSPDEIDYTGLDNPDVMLALAPEGVERRKAVIEGLSSDALVLQAKGVDIPDTKAEVKVVDFKGQGLKKVDWSLAGLAVLAKWNRVINLDMLHCAIKERFPAKVAESAAALVDKVEA